MVKAYVKIKKWCHMEKAIEGGPPNYTRKLFGREVIAIAAEQKMDSNALISYLVNTIELEPIC